MKHKALVEPKPFKAFRDKYLAVVMMVAALFITFFASAQTDSAKYSRISGYGFTYKRWGGDSIVMIPLSSSPHTPYRPGAIRYKIADSTLQLWTGHQWNSIITGGNSIDTAYALNDSTIAIETPNQTFFVVLKGQNISNTSLIADGDYMQNWNRHQLIIDTTKDIRIYSNAPDWNFTNNIHTFLFEHYNSVIGPKPLSLKWALRDVTNSFDSTGGGIVSDLYGGTIVNHYTGSQSGQLALSDGGAQLLAQGNHASSITASDGTITLDAADSLMARLKPGASAAGDSMIVSRNLHFGLNTLYKVPVPAGGSTALSNQGSGFRLVKTADGQIKTVFGGYGIMPDSSTNTNGITFKADTSSTNHLVTQSDLNDSSAALRAAIGSGGSGEANTASNQGSGAGLFKTKSGVDLQFKSVTSDATITVTGNTDDLNFKSDTAYLKGVYLPLTLPSAKTINQANHNIFFTGGGEHKSDSTKLTELTAPPIVSGLVVVGQSIMYGQGASTNDSTLKYRNSHYYGLPLIDLSLSASGIWRAASNFYLNIDPGHSNVTMVMAGLNDVRRNGWAAMTHSKLINGYNAIFVNQYLASWVPAGDASVDKSGGTWSVGYTSSTVGGKSVGLGMFSSTLNDYAEWTFTGTNVVVGLMGADGVGGSNYEYAQFEIYVDGVLKKSGNETGQWDGVSDGVNDNKRGTYPIIITGLSSGSHTVRVKQKESGKYFVVDYFGTLVSPAVGKPLILYHDPYLTSPGYATSPSNASNAILDSLNTLIDSLRTVYTGLGYPVYRVQTNSYYNTSTGTGGDGIHPNDLGYQQMFNATKATISTFLIPATSGTMYFTNNGKVYIGLPDGTVKSFAYDGDTSSYIRNQTANTQTGGFKINGTGTANTLVANTGTFGNISMSSPTGSLLNFSPVAGQTVTSYTGSITGSVVTNDAEVSATGGLNWVQRNLSTASGAYSALSLAVKGNGNGTGGAQLTFRNDGIGREFVTGYDVGSGKFRIAYGNQQQFNGQSFFSLDTLTGHMYIATPPDGNSSDSMLVWRSSDSSVRKVVAPSTGTSGTYTPTLTSETNIASTTAFPCQYMRVGNVVTVSGKFYIDYTSTGTSSIGISLPIPSNIGNDYEIGGTAHDGINGGGMIHGDAVNDRAQFYITTQSSAGYDYFFTFTYQVL